jgi:hypothetical protein
MCPHCLLAGLAMPDREPLPEMDEDPRQIGPYFLVEQPGEGVTGIENGQPAPAPANFEWAPMWEEFDARHPNYQPLKPSREVLLHWHRNQEAFFGPDSVSGKWHRARLEALEAESAEAKCGRRLGYRNDQSRRASPHQAGGGQLWLRI